MTYVAKRRNKAKPAAAPQRRRQSPTLEAPPAAGLTEEPRAAAPTKRRRRADVGGFHLKLACPERAGFQRRWFNDTPGRLAYAEELAYSHVTESGIKSDSPDSRVRRLVGTQASGQPLYAYLMETPLEEYRAGIDEKEEAHRAIDDAINAGRDATGRVSNAYGHGEIGER